MSRPRVLLVDDAEELRILLRLLIEKDGRMEVVGEAGDGRAGVEQAAATQPDLVVLDLAMPVLDGLAAAPLIKEAAPAARIVVLTGFDEVVLPLDLPIDGFVTKGSGFDHLLDTLARVAGVAA